MPPEMLRCLRPVQDDAATLGPAMPRATSLEVDEAPIQTACWVAAEMASVMVGLAPTKVSVPMA